MVLISSSRIRAYSLLYWPKVYIPHCGGPFFWMSLGIIPFSTLFWQCYLIHLSIMSHFYIYFYFTERIMRCLLSGRSGLQFASLLWPFMRLLSCCLVSPMYWRPQSAHIENIIYLLECAICGPEAMQIANLIFHSADISDRRATMILSVNWRSP
jgi:hypothetical protein